MGWNVGKYRSLTFFRGRTRFPLFLTLLLSFDTSYGRTTVLKQIPQNNSSKEFVLRSSCRVSPLLRGVPLFLFNYYTPMLVRLCYVGLYRWTSLTFLHSF